MKNKIVMFFAIWLFFFTVFSSQAITQTGSKFRVLVLMSYHKGIPWVNENLVGIEDALTSLDIDYDMRLEYMDTKNILFDDAYQDKLHDLYAYKYQNYKFDAIISLDNNALTFLHRYSETLFGNTPIIFGGLDDKGFVKLLDQNKYTGILELTNHSALIDLAISMYPETNKIFYLGDSMFTEKGVWQKIQENSSNYPALQFVRVDEDLLLSDVEDFVEELPENSLVFYYGIYWDKVGYIPFDESMARISKASKRPVYSMTEHNIKYGALGGNVIIGRNYGRELAAISARVYQGEKVSNIPVVNDFGATSLFNYDQLVRFGLYIDTLPEDSTILNSPYSFYGEYKVLVWSTIVIILALLTVIFVLQFNIVNRKKAESKLLRRTDELYQSRLEAMERLGRAAEYRDNETGMHAC
ncbi:MAG: hypothetical protein HOH19_06470 [Kordiimonadaceae bacterium]|nr:hypothetical protein [Kordiimonadaceae bacterium]